MIDNWREREIESFDKALARYAANRKASDIREAQLWSEAVDEILDRRNKLTEEIKLGLP